MTPERSSYSLELPYPHKSNTAASGPNTYRSFERAMAKATLQARRRRIIEHRVVWRSIPIGQRRG